MSYVQHLQGRERYSESVGPRIGRNVQKAVSYGKAFRRVVGSIHYGRGINDVISARIQTVIVRGVFIPVLIGEDCVTCGIVHYRGDGSKIQSIKTPRRGSRFSYHYLPIGMFFYRKYAAVIRGLGSSVHYYILDEVKIGRSHVRTVNNRIGKSFFTVDFGSAGKLNAEFVGRYRVTRAQIVTVRSQRALNSARQRYDRVILRNVIPGVFILYIGHFDKAYLQEYRFVFAYGSVVKLRPVESKQFFPAHGGSVYRKSAYFSPHGRIHKYVQEQFIGGVGCIVRFAVFNRYTRLIYDVYAQSTLFYRDFLRKLRAARFYDDGFENIIFKH